MTAFLSPQRVNLEMRRWLLRVRLLLGGLDCVRDLQLRPHLITCSNFAGTLSPTASSGRATGITSRRP